MKKATLFKLVIAGILIVLFMSSCSDLPGSADINVPLPASATPATPPATPPAVDASTAPTEPADIIESVASRTPQPTATPSALDQAVRQFTASRELNQFRFLGLTAENWINLGISILFIFLAYTLGGWIFKVLLQQLARTTKTEMDDLFVVSFASALRWFLVIWVFQFSTRRLSFIDQSGQQALIDINFILYLSAFVYLIWRLFDYLIEWYFHSLSKRVESSIMSGVLISVRRTVHIVILIIAGIVLMDHLGLNITGITAAFGIIGLAFSLAAKDTLSDAISGYILLFDQPFRVGDRIEIQELDTWGDVVDIGIRTTRIQTLDNRMVIVPNSIISKNQVVNLTYPDPRYVMSIKVSLAYGTDIEQARHVICETVKNVEGVLEDQPVRVYYREMGDSAMIFQVVWWISSFRDRLSSFDQVNTALQHTLEAAGIEMPYPTYQILYSQTSGQKPDGEA